MHHLGLLLDCQGVLHFGQHGAEGMSRSEDNIHAKLPADPSDIPFCLVCLPNPPGGFGRGADKGTGVFVLPQNTGEVVFFLPQSVLLGGDGCGSVEQAPDQSPLWFPVDGDVLTAIIPPLEHDVKKRESSVFRHPYSEPDGQSHTVQVGQEFFHCALLHDAAGVINLIFQSQLFVAAVLSMYRSVTIAETGDPVTAPLCCSKNSP